MNPEVRCNEEVQAARAAGRPLVALESTIIAHGFPYPENLEMALAVEGEVRKAGAVPATVAIIDGEFVAGLTGAELEWVARSPDLPKASTRDLPVLAGLKRSAATTVASTAQVAAWAGIEVFVTGGIGGVHRGAGESFDVSADLQALSRLSLAVVCAGAKTVLDIPATLEYLETHGVTVVGFGTDTFPGFYIPSTGEPVDVRVDTPEEAAAILRARQALGMLGAVLVTNPIPAEHALDPVALAQWLQAAESGMAAAGVKGKAVTPYLLAHLHRISQGRTVAANKALVLHNAGLGARLAIALASAR